MRIVPKLAVAILAAAALVVAAVPALAAASAPHLPVLVAVRAAHHEGFDRITFEFRGQRPAHRIGYVSQLIADGSGEPVRLAGGAAVNVVFQGADAHDAAGSPTVPTRHLTPRLPSLKEAALIGDFEGVVTYGLGVDHKLPFKVLELDSPSRIAIDVTTATAGGTGAATSTGTSGTAGGTGTSGGTAAGATDASGGTAASGSSDGTGGSGTGQLPFTGSRAPSLLLEGLGLAAVGGLVLLLARRTRVR